MEFEHSEKSQRIQAQLRNFIAEHVAPRSAEHYRLVEEEHVFPPPFMEDLKAKARAAGLWNLFLPGLKPDEPGTRMSNLDYAPCAEIMGRIYWSSEVFNCSAPDTGNAEVLVRYGSAEQKQRWLEPLLAGEIRSAFAMTEPAVASSDATNIRSSIKRDGDHYVINGRKWWTSGAPDKRCKIMIFMGKTAPDAPEKHRRQSMVLVPMDTPGVKMLRSLHVFGYDDAPHGHGEVLFENVRVPVSNILLGEGRGFEIAQGRLGPGRIHHCMRLIGLAERVLERMCRRADLRSPFGRPLSEQGVTLERIAKSRILIDQSRLLTLNAAWMMDTVGNKVARSEIAMIKVAAPEMACQIIDWAMQVFGGGGTNNDYFLGSAYATARLLRLADGPDEVHRNQIARLELRRHRGTDPAQTGGGAAVLTLREVEEIGAAGPGRRS